MDETSTCYGGGDIAGAVFGTLIGGVLLAFLLFWLYKNYWKNRNDTKLVQEDPENVKQEFAFDNPAFKGEGSKVATGSPLDTKWTSDKRKTVDDTHTGSPSPRLVSLRGSDFTGLGIEICGGLKEGIYVKKIMPQGPAANIVRIGDKITSITIDLRHMVQEDAATILSYASPYNVQLELLDGKGVLPHSVLQQSAHSPKANSQHQTLTHPLYRSSSQEDFNTIERNARKKHFPNDDGNYPTLKMEQNGQKNNLTQSPQSSNNLLPVVFKENEKKIGGGVIKAQVIVDEKLQNRSAFGGGGSGAIGVIDEPTSPTVSETDSKKALKFGVRVLPPNVNDKINRSSITEVTETTPPTTTTTTTIISPNNEIDSVKKQSLTPPPVNKRTKHNKTDESKQIANAAAIITATNLINNGQITSPENGGTSSVTTTTTTITTNEFERQGSINSSGIRRDAAGIPQEIPNQMMAAAMAARDHRKSSANSAIVSAAAAEAKKGKGKAPKPPPEIENINDTVNTTMTNISMDTTDHALNITTPSLYKTANGSAQLNFTDNFGNQELNLSDISAYAEHATMDDLRLSPANDRKMIGSDTESQFAAYDHDSDNETTTSSSNGNQIELNSKQITVHQTSEEESGDEEHRRTASLGDLSSGVTKNTIGGGGGGGTHHNPSHSSRAHQNGTLERAQSLEMSSDATLSLAPKVTPKKRKAPPTAEVESSEFNKEPRLSAIDKPGRLKSAYEWGNLNDAIYDTDLQKSLDDETYPDDYENNSDAVVGDSENKSKLNGNGNATTESFNTSMISHVMAVADNFAVGRKISSDDEDVSAKMEKLNEERKEILSKVADDGKSSDMIVTQMEHITEKPLQNGFLNKTSESFDVTWDNSMKISPKSISNDLNKNLENSIKKFIETESQNGVNDSSIHNTIITTTTVTNPRKSDGSSASNYDNVGGGYGISSGVSGYKRTISPIQFDFKANDPITVQTTTSTTTISSTTLNSQPDLSESSSSSAVAIGVDVADNNVNVNNSEQQINIINYGTNMPDDVKVSQYPFSSLEHRPIDRSEVLKKLLANQMTAEDFDQFTNSTITKTTIRGDVDSTPPNTPIAVGDQEPISFTLNNTTGKIGGQIESSQISSVYSSDGQGVNSISISSLEIRPDSRRSMENVVTISTDSGRLSSQPSSIILIDDEQIDFTLRTSDEDKGGRKSSSSSSAHNNTKSSTKDEVFIIESLSSKKVSGIKPPSSSLSSLIITPTTSLSTSSLSSSSSSSPPPPSQQQQQQQSTTTSSSSDDAKTFVTEIHVQTQKDSQKTKDSSQIDSEFMSNKPPNGKPPHSPPTSKLQSSRSSSSSYEGEYIPRNSEMKFTTATYESSSPQRHYGIATTGGSGSVGNISNIISSPIGGGTTNGEKRHSQIDQIRSTFERHHSQSEIPVPVRKTSIPRTSPSKIPVFLTKSNSLNTSSNEITLKNNNSSVHNSNNNLSSTVNNNNTNNNNNNINNNTNNNNNNNNRVSVTVTSIKNSSRNPSGK